jgi:ribosomal protein S27E
MVFISISPSFAACHASQRHQVASTCRSAVGGRADIAGDAARSGNPRDAPKPVFTGTAGLAAGNRLSPCAPTCPTSSHRALAAARFNVSYANLVRYFMQTHHLLTLAVNRAVPCINFATHLFDGESCGANHYEIECRDCCSQNAAYHRARSNLRCRSASRCLSRPANISQNGMPAE